MILGEGLKQDGNKIKIVRDIKQDAKNSTKLKNYKTSIPSSEISESYTLKEIPVVKPVVKAAEIKKVLPMDESENSVKEEQKVKKITAKEVKPSKTEDKRDYKLLRKLAEVHSFPRPPLPKLDEENDGWTHDERPLPKEKAYSQDISIDDIMMGDVIGQGAYAVVRKGLYIPANLTIAIKIYDKSKLEEPQRRKSVKREIKLMEMMDNEFIVKLYGVIETRHQLYILMEYVSGLSLHGYLKLHRDRRLPEHEARRIYHQLMLGLKYCHKK